MENEYVPPYTQEQILRNTIEVYNNMITMLEKIKIKNLKGVSTRLGTGLGIIQTENKIETIIDQIIDSEKGQLRLLEGKLLKLEQKK